MDIIFIDDLRIQTLIGIYPRERAIPQTLEISLQIGTQSGKAGESEDLGDTVDYAAVVERVKAELASRHFLLLETLAEHIAALLLADFGACWVRVCVAKIGMIRNVRRAGVIIERGEPTAHRKAQSS